MHLTVFRFTYRAVAVLCFLDASLVMASLPLAHRARISEQAVIVSAIVAIAFVLVGLLVFRIAGQVSTLCLLRPPETGLPTLAAQLRGLLTSLVWAGLMFGAILGLVTLGLLSRIGEGFAVFG